MADGQYSIPTMLGFGALAFNSGLAIYRSWGDAASVLFVLAADAALVLLFGCLRAFEQGGRGRDATKIKAAVWALTTLLTAMFASRVAPLMPVAVGGVVSLCLGEIDHQIRGGGGEGGGRGNMGGQGQYCALAKVGVAVLTCDSALQAYHTQRDSTGSAAFVFVSYAALAILTGLFVRVVARAHAAEQGQQH